MDLETPPDLILVAAHVLTPDASDARAVAITGDRITAVGNPESIEATAGPSTRVLRFDDKCIVPGFIDAHVHFLTGGFELLGPDLHDTASEDEFGDRLAVAAARVPPGTWILGGGWDHEAWPGHQYPRRSNIDPKVPDHPVFVRRTDGHIAFANSAALARAGVDENTKSPVGGVIVRDPATGKPTGVLKDSAMELVLAKIPEPDLEARLRAAHEAMALAARNGVTMVHDMGGTHDLEVYRELERRGQLTMRIRFYFPLSARSQAIAERPHASDMVRVQGVKAFADGSLGAGTAFMFEAFTDEPGNKGLRDASFEDRDGFREGLLEADRAGLQACVHAIGDRANREVLDMFAEIARINGPRDRRQRIEHAQHLTVEDIPRFAELGVIASMQPYHAIDDGRWAERRLGEVRSRTTYAFRSLLDSGAGLAFGTDWFVAPLDPVQTLAAAVTRASLDGKHPGGWVPEQKITVAEALRCMTANAAFAGFDEDSLGRVAPGYLADLVVLSRDPLTTPAGELDELRVEATIVDGRIVSPR